MPRLRRFGLLEFNVSLSHIDIYRDNANQRNESLYCPDRDSIPVSQDTMTSNHQRVDKTTPQTAHPSGLAGSGGVLHMYSTVGCAIWCCPDIRWY